MKFSWNPLDWFNTKVKFEPQPIELNPTKIRQKERALMRLERVEAAIAKGDKRSVLVEEARKLRQFIEWVS